MNHYNDALNLQAKSTNSAGEAMKRYQTYAESTRAKLEDLKGSIQRFWTQTISSKEINQAVDGLNKIVKVFSFLSSKFGVIPTLLTGIVPILTQFSKFREFKPIDLTSSTASIRIFGKSLGDVKSSFANLKKNYADSIKSIQLLNGTTNKSPSIFERARASLEMLRSTTVATTIATGTLRLMEIALNAAITMGISVGIGILIQKLTDYINKVDTLKQKNQELLQTSHQNIQEHESNIATLSEMSQKYKDVYDRIQQFKNSGKTPLAEDTKELNQMNDELAQKFPDIVSGYNEQGHAVLNLNGDLKKIIDTEKEKARWESQKVINDSGFKEESEAEKKALNERIGFLKNSYGILGNFKNDFKQFFTHPIRYFQDMSADSSKAAKMVSQLNKQVTNTSGWYKSIIPDILKIDSSYQKLNPALQTSIKNWAMQNTEFSKMKKGTDVQKAINSITKMYANPSTGKMISTINRLTKEFKNGAIPVNAYKKDVDDLIKSIKKISGTSLSENELKKLFKVDTNGLNQSLATINKLNKSAKEFKNQFTDDIKEISVLQKVLNDIKTTGKLSEADKEIIKKDPDLVPYLDDIKGLVGAIDDKTKDLKKDSETAFVNSQIKDEEDNLRDLEDTYTTLASKTSLTAGEKKKLADTTAALKNLIPGLIDVTNGDSEAIDTNRKMIDEKINSLDSEGQYLALVAQVGQAKAKAMIEAAIDETQKTINEANNRIATYKIEMGWIRGLITLIEKIPIIGGLIKKTTIGRDITDLNYNTELLHQSEKKLSALKDEANSEKQGDIDWGTYLNKYNREAAAVKSNTEAHSQNAQAQQNDTNAGNSNSDATDDNSKAKDKNSDATEKNTKTLELNTETMDRAKEVAKEYELQLSSLDNVIKKQEDTVDNYAKGSEKRREAITQELDLVKQQIKMYGAAASNASSVSSTASMVANQAGSALGQQIVTNAEKYLGTPYVYGGESPGGFDCSGLVQYVYKQVGVQLSRTTYDQFKQGTPVSQSDLAPGDLVFFEPSSKGPGHVGIYAGDGNVVEAPHTGDVVKVASLSGMISSDGYVGARRIISGNGNDTGLEATSSKLTYADLVNSAGQKYGVDPNLIAGVIKVESDWDPNATSSAGAKGLMQLMDSTASSLGVADSYNPYQNVMGGVAYLAQLLQHYGGNKTLALAAYNEGEGNLASHGIFSSTRGYVNKVLNYASQFADKTLAMPTDTVSGTLSDEQDMAQKVEDYMAKVEENEQKLHELYKDWYEDWISQYENQIKAIDSSIEKMQSMKELDGENDNAYITNLKQILDTTDSKILLLKNEEKFINEQLKNPGGVYTFAVLQEMQEKATEVENSIYSVEKDVKDAGNAWAQSKFDNITNTIKDNLTLIENALNRLDDAKTVDLTNKLSLQTQKVDEDKKYIQDLTDLLRELNEEEMKTGSAYLFDKIKEINAEMDKAKTTLADDNKGIQDIKDNINDLTSTILDKIKEIIQKNNDLLKDELDKDLKLFEDAIDKEVDKLEEAKKKLDNNKTDYSDIQNINDLQKQLNAIQGDDAASKAQVADLQKQLDEANRQFIGDTMDQNIQDREDALNKAKDDYEKIEESYVDALDKSDEDTNLNKRANQFLLNGYLVDSNGNKLDLETALKNYEDEFGEGLTVIGNKIKTELIDQLKEVQDLMNNFGTLDTTKMDSNPTIRTVYGTGVDLQNAEQILGSEGFRYVDTNSTPSSQVNPKIGDVVLDVGTSIDKNKINGATNLTGKTRYQTALFLKMFSDTLDGKIPDISQYNDDTMWNYIKQFGIISQSGRVFGSGTDLENAQKLLSKFGYTFINTDDISGVKLGSNDIVVGGPGVMKGSEGILSSGARWIWGNTAKDTLTGLQNLLDLFNRFPVDIEGFKEGGDVDFTGMAMLHGSSTKPETVLNYDQGQGLHSFLVNLPNMINEQLENNRLDLKDSTIVQQYNNVMSKIQDIIDNNINKPNATDTVASKKQYIVQIDKVYGEKDVGEKVATDALSYFNKMG